jgi:hypothetical protein
VRSIRTARTGVFDNNGEVTESDPIVIAYVFDPNGKVKEELVDASPDYSNYKAKRVFIYDRTDTLRERVSYDPQDKVVERSPIIYDEKGRLSQTSYWAFINLDAGEPWLFTTKYSYSSAGRTVELVVATRDGRKVSMRDVTTCDLAGNPRSTEHFVADKLNSRMTYEYDSQGRLASWVERPSDGGGETRENYSYDPAGNLIEKAQYKDESTPTVYREVYSYEFDSHGNWTKQAESSEMYIIESGKKKILSSLSPRGLVRRTITYFK